MKMIFKIITGNKCWDLAAAFVVLLAIGGISAPLPAQTDGAGVRGRVVDQNQAAIVDATVSVHLAGGVRTVETNTNGEFVLPLPVGSFTLEISAAGFADSFQTVNASSGQAALMIVILSPAPSTAVVNILTTDTFGYRVESLNTATKTLTALRDVAQSITVVGSEQIKDQSLASIAEVMNYVPGITSHQGENNRDQLVIRGNSSSADFFLNGVRDDVQYYRDLYNVQQVEALKGPNALTFGRGGGGGVVNRVTKQAGFTSLRQFIFQTGSFSNQRISGDVNQTVNQKLAFRLNGVYENSGSFRRFVGLQRYGLNPTITYAPGTATVLVLSFEHFHDGRVADRGVPSYRGLPVAVPVSTFYGDPQNSYVRANVNLLSGWLERQLGKLNIRNRTQFGDYDRGYQNYVPGAVNAARTLVALSAYNNATRRRNLFNQTDVTVLWSTGRVKHTILSGAEIGRQSTNNFRKTGFFDNTATTIQIPFDNTVIGTAVVFRQSATDANNHVLAKLAGAYLQDQIELSRHVQFMTGVRYDYFDLGFHNNRTGEHLRRIDRLVSPRAGVVVKPVMPLSIYASYGVSYLPSSGDQFSSLTAVTQQVKPEKFTNYELGAKWDVRRNLTLTTAIYRQDRTNTRSVDPKDPTRIVQTGSQRTDGFELGANGSITRKWRIIGGYAQQAAVITSATASAVKGAQVAMVPHHTFSLWNNYQLMKKLGLGLGLVHRADMFAAIDNTVVLPGYTRADAVFFFDFSERWRVQTNLTNLFNQKYYLNADGNNNISPGSPRSVRVSVAASF